jgi:hypothetical protein
MHVVSTLDVDCSSQMQCPFFSFTSTETGQCPSRLTSIIHAGDGSKVYSTHSVNSSTVLSAQNLEPMLTINDWESGKSAEQKLQPRKDAILQNLVVKEDEIPMIKTC